MTGDVIAAEALRIATGLERRAVATDDADDAKAALLIRLLVAIWQNEAADNAAGDIAAH
jgi:hypothetical protein